MSASLGLLSDHAPTMTLRAYMEAAACSARRCEALGDRPHAADEATAAACAARCIARELTACHDDGCAASWSATATSLAQFAEALRARA